MKEGEKVNWIKWIHLRWMCHTKSENKIAKFPEKRQDENSFECKQHISIIMADNIQTPTFFHLITNFPYFYHKLTYTYIVLNAKEIS